MDLYLRNEDLYTWFSEKKGTLTWINGPFTDDLWKMRTFMCDFLKKKCTSKMKNVYIYAWFSEKRALQPEKCGSLLVIFLKIWTFTWKMLTFTHDFLKKSGPRPVNVDLLRMIFWNMWTSTWKMWTFMIDFLEKSRPPPGKCGLLRVIFWRKWPSTCLRKVD